MHGAYDEYSTLSKIVRAGTEGFYHTTPLITFEAKGDSNGGDMGSKLRSEEGSAPQNHRFTVDLRDFCLIAMVAGGNVLITGKTGGGKTTFGRALLESVFGDNYGFIQVDTKLDENKFRNILFKKMQEGGTLSDAVEPNKAITAPGVLIDEYNRAPAVLASTLQGYLVNGTVTFEGGAEAVPGIKLPGSGRRYQFKVATVNEGMAYYGTNQIDKAARDRFPIEIPLDVFPPDDKDIGERLVKGPFERKPVSQETAKKATEALYALIEKAKQIPVRTTTRYFLTYLEHMDNCYRSPEGTKLSLTNFSPEETCVGCHAFAKNKGICGNVNAPGERTIDNLETAARAFAAYRIYRLPDTAKDVTIEDVFAVAPFVLYSKLEIRQGWQEKFGDHSKWNSVDMALREIHSRWRETLEKNRDLFDAAANAQRPLTPDESRRLFDVYAENPWMAQQEDIRKVYRYLLRASGGVRQRSTP
jgi:MoxR-like ATPase